MSALLRLCCFLLLLCACSQEPYALDHASIASLNGALPDSDPGLLDQRVDPGHEMEGEVRAADGRLEGDVVPIAPQIQALLDDEAGASARSDANAQREALLFSGSTLDLVTNTTTTPQRAVVQLQIDWKDGEASVCSGTLIRADAVLTAAHCAFDYKHGGFAYSISVAPGKQGNNEPYGRIWVKKSFAPTTYRDLDGTSGKYPYDYGVLRLKSSFTVGARSLAEGSSALDRAFVLRGYPGNRTTRYDGLHMYESRDRIRKILSNGVFYHRASTIGGMSGAGVDDGSRIIGVHTSGASDNNSGVVFSSTTLTVIRDWAARAL